LLLSFACPKEEYYFLCLDTKKVIKEKSRLQNILGFVFLSLPTQYNSLSAKWRIAQTVLLTAGLRSKLKNIHFFPKCFKAGLNPLKIWGHCSPCGDLGST